MEQVMEAVKGRERWTSKHIAEQCDISKRQVHEHLKTLSERGYVTVEQDGQAFVWSDDRLEYVGEHGDVSFSDLDLGELAPADEHEVARNTVFTWDFTPSGTASAPTGPGTVNGAAEARADGGEHPSGEEDPPE
jgi:DNA-binding transcriptional ArsR family regulator